MYRTINELEAAKDKHIFCAHITFKYNFFIDMDTMRVRQASNAVISS